MDQNKLQTVLKKVGWNFNEIVHIAKDIKPSGWIAIVNKSRLSFIEVSLGAEGPATVEKQLVLNENLELEVYLGGQKLEEERFPCNLSKVKSSKELYAFLKSFSSFGICQGNKNFKRINKNGEIIATDYWKDTNCHRVYDKALRRPENCCDACLQLNQLLPKKINNTYLSLSQPIVYKSVAKKHSVSSKEPLRMERQMTGKRKKLETGNERKKIKQEIEEVPYITTEFITVKEEPLY